MKYILIFLLIFINFFNISSINANNQNYKQSSFYNFDLKASWIDWKISLNWTPYFDSENVAYYKIVYSKTNNNPDLNNSDSLTISKIWFEKNSKQFIWFGEYYVKLCMITQTEDILCGNTIKVKIQKNKKISKRDIEDYQNRFAGADEKIKIIKKYELSNKMKKKIEKIIKNYVQKLKNKKYSIWKINRILEKIIKKVDVLKPKYKNDKKITAILDYLNIILEENKIYVK